MAEIDSLRARLIEALEAQVKVELLVEQLTERSAKAEERAEKAEAEVQRLKDDLNARSWAQGDRHNDELRYAAVGKKLAEDRATKAEAKLKRVEAAVFQHPFGVPLMGAQRACVFCGRPEDLGGHNPGCALHED